MDKSLSVYILTYNRAEYLRQSIQSVLDQSYRDFKLYILDNCSEDNTQEVVSSFCDTRIQYIRHEKNIGAFGNIAFALEHCTTDFVVMFHDDDVMDERLLEREFAVISSRDDLAAVSSQCVHVGNDRLDQLQTQTVEYAGGELIERYIKEDHTLCFPSIMYRSAFMKEHSILPDPSVGASFDVIFYGDIERYGGRICELPDELLMYRSHEKQWSQEQLGLMHAQLIKYMRGVEYYSRQLDKNPQSQGALYARTAKRITYRYAISRRGTRAETMTMIDEIGSLLKHSKKTELIYKILITVNACCPPLLPWVYAVEHHRDAGVNR